MRFIDYALFFKDRESFWVRKDVVRNGHEVIVGPEVGQIIRGSNHQNYNVLESCDVNNEGQHHYFWVSFTPEMNSNIIIQI